MSTYKLKVSCLLTKPDILIAKEVMELCDCDTLSKWLRQLVRDANLKYLEDDCIRLGEYKASLHDDYVEIIDYQLGDKLATLLIGNRETSDTYDS